MLTFQKLHFLQRKDCIFCQKHSGSAYHWQGNLLLLEFDEMTVFISKITGPDLKGHQTYEQDALSKSQHNTELRENGEPDK